MNHAISYSRRRYPDLFPSVTQSSGSGAWLFMPLILSSIFLEKIALPIADNTLSVNTVIMPLLALVAVYRKDIHFDPQTITYYMLFFLVAGLGFLLVVPDNEVSVPALLLLAFVQLPLATRPEANRFDQAAAMQMYSSVLFFVSLLSIIQFASEWFVPRAISFPLDYYLPKAIALTGYNNLNPLEYASDRIKSNGVFFAEPSYLCQELALAALVELRGKVRPWRMLGFAAGMLVSYSGSGLLIFLPFAAVIVARKRGLWALVLCGALIPICIGFSDTLRLDTMTRRIFEFQTTGTSGNARFISIFDLIGQYQVSNAANILFGLGPGQVIPFIKRLPYDGFGPTWGKVLFEYGLCGLLVYILFLRQIFRHAICSIKTPLLLTYLFLGGYLADTTFIVLILLFVAWAPRRSVRRGGRLVSPSVNVELGAITHVAPTSQGLAI